MTTEITIEVLKALRERTGAGIVACRNALVEAGGDTERAADLLRAREAEVARSKVQRAATQGAIGVRMAGTRVALVEVNCESDFVGRGAEFIDAVSECLAIALDRADAGGDALQTDAAIASVLTALSARTGERILLRRARIVEVAADRVVSIYAHGGNGRDVGRIGVVVETNLAPSPEAEALAHGVAMHIAASAPLWIAADDVPSDVLEAKRAEFRAEAERAGKPAAIVPRIVAGRVDKFLAESTLLGQPYALNPDERVGEVLRRAGESLGVTPAVRQYVRFQAGETASD